MAPSSQPIDQTTINDDSFTPFLSSAHLTSSLPEYHTSLSLIHHLDHAWFFQNVFPLPCFPSCFPLPSPPTSPPSLPPTHNLSPFRSVEMVQPLDPPTTASPSSGSQLPRARFDKMPRRRALERDKQRSRLLKEFGEIHIQVPRRLMGKSALRERLMPIEAREDSKLSVGYTLSDVREEEHQSPFYVKEHDISTETFRQPKLETIASGKQLGICAVETSELEIPQTRRRRRDRRKNSKSMTDLEFDELKGFMELGFQFSKDDLTPRVVNMFPGLRRQFGDDDDSNRSSRRVPYKNQPYPPEAWLRRYDSPLLNWRIPGPNEEGVDMKEHLKFWARAVASTVRQEC